MIFKHVDTEPTRSGWFECSCCPTNLVRLIPSIPGYMYAQKNDSLYVNLFINSSTTFNIAHQQVQLVQQNNYPWSGALGFTIDMKSPGQFSLMIRIPGWAQNKAMPSDLYRFQDQSAPPPAIKINGEAVNYTINNGYAVFKRIWKKNDRIEVNLPMEVRKIAANENVKEDQNKLALQRGPLLYCAEWVDNQGKTSNILLPENTIFNSVFKPQLLNGIIVLQAMTPAVVINDNETVATTRQSLTAIPYYSWANRGKGEMMVWFPTRIKDIDLVP